MSKDCVVLILAYCTNANQLHALPPENPKLAVANKMLENRYTSDDPCLKLFYKAQRKIG